MFHTIAETIEAKVTFEFTIKIDNPCHFIRFDCFCTYAYTNSNFLFYFSNFFFISNHNNNFNDKIYLVFVCDRSYFSIVETIISINIVMGLAFSAEKFECGGGDKNTITTLVACMHDRMLNAKYEFET